MINKYYARLIRKYNRRIKKIPSGYTPLLGKLENIGAVIFDIYGTLLITENRLNKDNAGMDKKVMQHLAGIIRKYSLHQWQPAELVKAVQKEIAEGHRQSQSKGIDFPEIDIIKIWGKILDTSHNADNTALAANLAFEYEMIMNNIYPSGNLKALFNYLKRKKIKTGIVSNAQFYTEIILTYFLGSELMKNGFDAQLLLYSYKYGIAKPAAYLFNKMRKKAGSLGLKPENVLYIGNDLINDMVPAAQAGFRTALYAGDQRSILNAGNESCSPALPEIVITDWRQIKSIII